MMNHGVSLDLAPRFRYHYSEINQNWNRVLQYPVCADPDAGICKPTIELAMSPSNKSRWEFIPQLRIHRHTIPFMRNDIFQDALPAKVWKQIENVVGENMLNFMAYSTTEQFLDSIDWRKYNDAEDDGIDGVPFQLIKSAACLAREQMIMRERHANKFSGDDHAVPAAPLPAFVTAGKRASKSKETI